MQNNLALIANYFKKFYKPTNNNLRISSNSRNKNVDTTPRYKNDSQSGEFGNQRTMNVAGARENVDSPVVQQSGIQCFNCKEFDTDEEIDEQKLEAHYSYMAKNQEVPTADTCIDYEPLEQVQNDNGYNVFANELQHYEQSESISNICLVETDDSNVILDSPDMCDDVIQNDQNDVESDDERVALANLKLDNKQTEFKKYKAFNDRTIDYDKLKLVKEKHDELIKQSLLTKSHYKGLVKQKQRLIPDGEETLALERESRSKLNKDSVRPYDYATLNSLYENFKPPTQELEIQLAHDMEILIQTCLMPLALKTQNDSFIFVHELKQEMHADLKYVESLEKEIDELESEKAEFSNMYDMILQECKGKSMETKFDKPSVVRQPNAQRIPKPSILGKPAPFLDSLERRYFSKTKSVPKTNVSKGLSKPVTAQTLPQTTRQAVSNTNVLKPGMYRIGNRTTQTKAPHSPQTVRNTNPHVFTSTRVNHKTNVSRPHHRSNQLKDKSMPNNSQVKLKKTQVEQHPRISSISNKIKSVTACNDSLNSRTSNANAVCATCKKYLVDSDHFACVTKMLNDVNARTKKPKVVPISTRKPKGHMNKSVATPYKKKVASKSTTQKPKSYNRMLYEKTSKAWKWWIEQQCQSGYKWVPKTKRQWIVQLILFIVDFGCTKHMTGNLKLCNFVEKFLGGVRFGNDQFAPILGYGDLVQGNIMINRVYYVEGLNYNLLSVGQFCDADLEDVVIGLPKLKYVKDQLCSSCEVSKANISSFKSKAISSSKGRLNLLHMDLCGPMRVASINGKKYILVIVDDYSRYTWTLFLRSKDETPKVLKEFLTMIQRNLQALVITLPNFLYSFEMKQLKPHDTLKTNPTSSRLMTKRHTTSSMTGNLQSNTFTFLVAFAIITRDGENLDKMKEKGDPCILVGYSTQSKGYHVYNKRTRLIVESIHIRFDEIKEMSKTFVANDTLGLVSQRQKASDYENFDLMKEKGDPCILVGYSTQSKGYHVYNKRTRLIVESIHIRFDEIKEMSKTFVANDTLGLVSQRQKASDYENFDLVAQLQNVSSLTNTHVPSQQELDLLFGPLYDEFFTVGSSSVNKSSSPTNNSNQQDTQPIMNIQPTLAPSTPTYVHAEENNDNQAEEEHL
nr:hypothetical protein [Tanacetum cinerariifolium]